MQNQMKVHVKRKYDSKQKDIKMLKALDNITEYLGSTINSDKYEHLLKVSPELEKLRKTFDIDF